MAQLPNERKENSHAIDCHSGSSERFNSMNCVNTPTFQVRQHVHKVIISLYIVSQQTSLVVPLSVLSEVKLSVGPL